MEWINVSGGLFVDAMIDEVHFKLLPIVQVHDATEYVFTWKLWAGCCIKTHKHTHNQKHCGLSLKLVFLPQCEAILPFEKKKITPSVRADTVKGGRQGICTN